MSYDPNYNPNPHDPHRQQGNQYGQYGPQGYQYGPGQYNPNQYNPQGGGQRQQNPGNQGQQDKGSSISAAWITGCLGIVAAVIGAIVAAVLTNGFGLMQHTNSPTSPGSPSSSIIQLHKDYNSGAWTEANGQIPFSLKGIVEGTDGKFTAAGGRLGNCNISVSNGVVNSDGSITFSITQIADVSTGCSEVTADLTGAVASNASSLSGTWSGQFQGQPFSGSWTLT